MSNDAMILPRRARLALVDPNQPLSLTKNPSGISGLVFENSLNILSRVEKLSLL